LFSTEQDLVQALTDSLVRDANLFAANVGTRRRGGASPEEMVTVLVGYKPPPRPIIPK
jgi:hypothetical protein